MSDVTPGLVPAPSSNVPPLFTPPIPADPPAFSAPVAEVATTQASPAPVSTAPGTAGLAEYAGDLGAAVSSFIPAKLRVILYPLGYVVAIGVTILGKDGVIDPSSSLLIAAAVLAFNTALATSNVPKGK